MVRYVNPPPEAVACSENSRFKSSICQPKDNIGISCVFSAGNASSTDKPSTGIRRKYAVPKDNLGVACLPSIESMRLRDIPEVSEYDSAEETYEKTPLSGNEKLRSTTTKITGRARCNAPKDNLSSSCRHVDRGVAIAQTRLRAGEDYGGQIQSRSATSAGLQIERVTQLKPKGNLDVFDESERFILPSKKMQFKSTSPDIGISNIRRPKHDPTQLRKLIVPKDNIGFSGRHLQKSSVRSSAQKTSAIYSPKKISSESEKKTSSAKSVSNLSEKRNDTQNKSLKANRYKRYNVRYVKPKGPTRIFERNWRSLEI